MGVSVATISSLITLVIMVMITSYHETDSFDNDQELGALEYSFVGLDSLVNAVCLFLLFEFNQNQYYRLCGACHDVIEKCCVRCAVSQFFATMDDGDDDADLEANDVRDLILR